MRLMPAGLACLMTERILVPEVCFDRWVAFALRSASFRHRQHDLKQNAKSLRRSGTTPHMLRTGFVRCTPGLTRGRRQP
jgi:hypothetical protein